MSISRWLKAAVLPLLFFVSCGKPLPTLDNVDLPAWQEDKRGCTGQRTSMMAALEGQSQKLLSLSQQDIIQLLGKPDENELYKRNQKFFYYFLQPSRTCSDSISDEPKKLVIRFNAMGLAKEVEIQ